MLKTDSINEVAHSLSIDEVFEKLASKEDGLQDIESRLKEYGFNEIPEKKGSHPVVIFLKQFHSILIYVLIVASIISYIFKHFLDVYVIVSVILINATMGYIQEYRAEQAIKALKKMMVPTAKVLRNGELLLINSRELVPGDIIILEEGDRVPADARLITVTKLRTIEAALTGESIPISKDIKILAKKTPLADRKNMVWSGTFVVSGYARAIVTATGINTISGKIAEEIEKISKTKGHFELKIDTLAKQLGLIAAASAFTTFSVGFFIRGFEFAEIFLFTIATLVSGIPEGLPAVLVVVLSIGAHRMAKRNAIIRRLPATETLGVVTVILTDKTGTLTKNTMTVENITFPDGTEIQV